VEVPIRNWYSQSIQAVKQQSARVCGVKTKRAGLPLPRYLRRLLLLLLLLLPLRCY